MANQDDKFKKVISHAKEYGYVFQSSEIYDGLSAVYDYAQNGAELKKNIRDYWWKAMVQMNENIVGIDAAIFMHPTTWKASGHVDAFNDPLIDNKDSKKRYRADVLIEDYCAKIEAKIEKEVKKAAKRFGDSFNKEEFVSTNGRVVAYQEKINSILARMGQSLEHWKETRLKWHLSLGMGADNYRFHDHEKLAHYADAAADIEFKFPFGFKELEGIHSRTDFDLKAHEEFSGKKLQYFDHEENKSYVPYVLETSIGLDRMFLAVFSNALQEEDLGDGKTRTVLKLPSVLAPTKAAVLPLVKKDGLPEVARKIVDDLKWDFNVAYDEKDAVGRRYRRQDANGTPFCITVDHDTLNDNTVTIRHRDSMKPTARHERGLVM